MNNKHFSSIKSKIFISYAPIILILIIFASFLYYITAYNMFLENYTMTSMQHTKIVSHQIDQHFENINGLQKKILESDTVREYIFDQAYLADFTYDRAFQKSIYEIAGYDFDFHHMNIVNLDTNHLITFGQEYSYKPYTITPTLNDILLRPTFDLNGALNIIPTDMGSLYKVDEDIHTISLLRSFGRYPLAPARAVIEMQINYNSLESLIYSTLLSYDNHSAQVIVFDKHKNLIYPYEVSEDLLTYYTSLDTRPSNNFRNPITKDNEIITSHTSDTIEFTTLLITPDSYVVRNKIFFRNIGIIIAITSLIVLFGISYRVARMISLPITRLRDSISHLELGSISIESNYTPDSDLNELELLSGAYNRMQIRLKESLDNIVKSRTLSIHSQIMALQAQMDSHFLYNTLTIISIMAEENDDMEVATMCIKLTKMLRYITEDYSKTTTFAQEIEHTRNYTDLMDIRFGRNISFVYETDMALNCIYIPKLIIQPFVENCIKYSRAENKILVIHIRTYEKNNHWYAEIYDNGNGFTSQSLEDIQNKIDSLNFEEPYPQLEINGMGIVNIYLRLKLFYANNFTFDISNSKDGAFITMGGSIHEGQ